jgi:hypothetical protein
MVSRGWNNATAGSLVCSSSSALKPKLAPVAGAAVASLASSCSGVMLSMIHADRPIVEITRSLRCTLMSVIGVAGRFCCSACQFLPALNDTKNPNSPPAYNRPACRGSSRITRVG